MVDPQLVLVGALALGRPWRVQIQGDPAGVAALLSGAIAALSGGPVIAIVSGGNVDVGKLATLLSST